MPSLEQAPALSNSSDPGSVSTLARRNRLTRFLSTLPLSSSFHRFLRDNFFAVVCDTFVYMGAPLLLFSQGLAGLSFLSLVPLLSRIKIRVPYAPSRTVDLFLARDFASRVPPTSSHKSRLILFVHGGAWGSGSPSMYRPLALGLLRRGFDVGLVGYRVYPAGDVDGQCEDVSKAVAAVESWSRSNSVSWSSVTLAGHSSGANISLVSLLRSPSPFVTKLALLSGVHDLAVHSDYEAMRGLEELSPLKSAAGFSRDAMFAGGARGGLGGLRPGFPEVFFYHGIADDVVPFLQSAQAMKALGGAGARVGGLFEEGADHIAPLMDIMFGTRQGKAARALESFCVSEAAPELFVAPGSRL